MLTVEQDTVLSVKSKLRQMLPETGIKHNKINSENGNC